MPNVIETAVEYAINAVDTYLVTESCTALLERDRKYFDLNFKGKGQIRIMDILLDSLADYSRAGSGDAGEGYTNYNGVGHADGYKIGHASAKWTTYGLRYDRGRSFIIDDQDNDETGGQLVANLLIAFIKEKVVPEKDATCFSAIAEKAYASLGNRVTETPTAEEGDSNILNLFEKGFAWLGNHGVADKDQAIYISQSEYYKVATAGNLNRYITQGDFKSERGVTFHLKAYGGRPITVVPDDRFYTDIVVGNGYAPSANSKAINYIIVDTKCVLPVTKVETTRVFKPDQVQDYDGYRINFRLYHDTIIPKNKIVGCYVSVGNTAGTSVANVLSLANRAGNVANSFVVDAYFTQPAALRGDLYMNTTTAFKVGSKYQASATNIKVEVGKENVVEQATTEAYFALVDSTGTAIAVSNGKIALSKK